LQFNEAEQKEWVMKKHTKDKNQANNPSVGIIPETGILEWFHINDYNYVEETVESLKELGVKHLRTGISWADYFTEDGEQWYDWLIPYLSDHFTILPCFLYTPPSIGVEEKVSAPPKNPKDFADFIDIILKRHGQHFEYVELWNEPNNISEYDYMLDESWDHFVTMISMASYWARQLGKKTVLGGMSPIDPNWLKHIASKNALQFIDVIGVHGFPDVFDVHWKGWNNNIEKVREVLDSYGLRQEIWITETGYSTWKHDERKQVENFLQMLEVPVNRVYWYSLKDLSPTISTVDGFHFDEREYHFGLITADGRQKLLYRLWAEGGIRNVVENAWITDQIQVVPKSKKEHVLITGGAGFIGTNLAHRLLKDGYGVTVFDNLSRPGVEKNLAWLKSIHPQIRAVIADVRDAYEVEKAVNDVAHVFHFAAQVAVTTSLENPVFDYEVNLKGTINVLEAIRKSAHQPSLIYTSTNKVYGNLEDVKIKANATRYYPEDKALEKQGISESRSLDFHSPYGSSKGAADQYVLDYARSYGFRTSVFRMSCIYGPHQFGTEDQGWVAHFILKALAKEEITLFGDGMQVRDILYADDLVNAFMLAWSKADELKGEVFNIGGGPSNVISLLELIKMLESLQQEKIAVHFEEWRKGDQKYYVSDFSKFLKATGWKPEHSYKEGVNKLYVWLKNHFHETGNHSSILTEKSFIS
jgi:CDP-paratose 2-epimerase